MSVLHKPQIEAYIGSTGSGKGVSIKRRLKELSPARIVTWDPRDEYREWGRAVSTLQDLAAALVKAKAGPVRIRYVAGEGGGKLPDQFERVCSLVWAAGKMAPLVFLAEELSDVTTASHPPPAWRRINTQGRHRGLHIIGAAQRPALIDKTFLGGCVYIRCFTLRYREDRRAMAGALDVDETILSQLQTVETERKTTINYYERHFRQGISRAGTIHLTR